VQIPWLVIVLHLLAVARHNGIAYRPFALADKPPVAPGASVLVGLEDSAHPTSLHLTNSSFSQAFSVTQDSHKSEGERNSRAGDDNIPLSRCGRDYYFVFASYGPEFRDMGEWEEYWQNTIPGKYRLWRGFSGGGVLAVSLTIPTRQRNLDLLRESGGKPIYGLVLGNESGQELSTCLACVTPDRPPGIAVKWGLAERVPNPTVTATAEHAECLHDERYLLVVPKAKRKSAIKLIDKLPEWFAKFGVNITSSPSEPPSVLRNEMCAWFTDPARSMWVVRMEGGEANAAWQLAVIYYVAEYWDVHARGLDSVHFVANIEGRPNFRKNWTSNK